MIVLCDRVVSERSGKLQRNEMEGNVARAAWKEDWKKVRRLVEQGGNVNDVDDTLNRRTALHFGAWYGNLDICSLVLSRGANVIQTDMYGDTPLHFAAYRHHVDICQLLVDHKADVTSVNNEGKTPLYIAVACWPDTPAVCHLITNESVNVADGHGNRALHVAASNGDIQIVQLLVDCGADVNVLNEDGQTPLHTAAGRKKDCPELCSILLKHNAKIDAVDKDGNQPLHLACKRRHAETGNVLLSHGADVTALNKQQQRPLHLANKAILNYFQVHSGDHALHIAARNGDIQTVQLLVDCRADVNVLNVDGQTPLHTAADGEKDCPELCSILLKHNAKIDAVDKDGNQPLHLACKRLNSKTRQLLLHHNADANVLNNKKYKPWHLASQQLTCNGNNALYKAAESADLHTVQLLVDWTADVNEVNENGQTPLHAAAGGEKDCPELCSMLLEHNAKIDAVDKDGNQPLHLACKRRHAETGSLLLSHGADVTALNKQRQRPLHLANESILKFFHLHGDHALHIAARNGDIQTVQLLVDCGADVNALNGDKQTPLHTAAGGEKDCPELCSMLLEHNAKIDAVDKDGNQPLHLACRKYHTKTGRLLLSNQADANALNKDVQTPLHTAAGGEKDCPELCSMLLEHNAKIDAVDKDGNQPLHLACRKYHTKTGRLLLSNQADANALNKDVQTPLHTAAGGEKDCPELCSMLLEHNAKIDAVDKDGNQPLHLACKLRHAATGNLLLSHGADVTALNKQQQSPLHLANESILKFFHLHGDHALHIAARNGDIQTVQLLVDCGADVNALNGDKQTPLHTAAGGEKDCPELCSMLLEHNAKIDAVDKDGNQPLHLACRKYHTKTGRLLLSNQADANALNGDGQTPLHTAAGGEKDCPELCSMLLEHKAKIDAVDKDGNQPLHLACKRLNSKTRQLLLHHNADANVLNNKKYKPWHLASQRLTSSYTKAIDGNGNNALYKAAESADLHTVQLLVDWTADVNEVNEDGQTPLHAAAGGEKDCPELCSILLKHNAKIDAVDKDGNQPLHLACRKYHTKTGRLLLSNQADANALNKDVQTPLHTAAGGLKDCPELCSMLLEHNAKIDAVDKDGNQPLHLACKLRHAATGNLLLSHGADVTALNKQQQSPLHLANESILKFFHLHGDHALHIAARNGDIQTVQLLVDCGADVNALNGDGQTPLHTAAGGEKDCPELCSMLLEHNAKIDAVDKDGNQPLHLACKRLNSKTRQLLLHHNADANVLNNKKYKPWHLASQRLTSSYTKAIDGNGNNALYKAAESADLHTVQLLVDWTADVNEVNEDGQTPLHAAAGGEKDCPELCSILLKHKAKIDAVDKDGNQPLHLACRKYHTKTGRLLLSNQADANALNGDGQTPLHTAAGGEKDCPELCSMLLEHKAKIDAVDKDGNQPLHLACKRLNSKTRQLLLHHNADANVLNNKKYKPWHLASQRLTSSYTKAIDGNGNNALYKAAESADLHTVQLLVDWTADVNEVNEDGQTPLHAAAGGEKDCPELCSILLKHNAKIDAVDKDGNQPLHLACRKYHTKTGRLLLSNQADANALNKDVQTPLHTAAGGLKDCPELCSMLLEHNAKIDAVDKDGNQPLHLACKLRHAATGNLLLSHGADVTALNKQQQSPLHLANESILKFFHLHGDHALHIAARNGDIQTVQLLVDCGADVNALNGDGQTPLHTAAGGEKDCPELCSMLLEHNAKIDAVDKDGNQPLHLACKRLNSKTRQLLLHHNADANVLNNKKYKPWHLASQRLTSSYTKAIDGNGNNALYKAAESADLHTVQLLVDWTADVNEVNEDGQTPLHAAAGGEKDCPELRSILLKHKAKIDAVDKDGNQPLHLACRKYHTKTGRLLLSNQADANALNGDGQTPLHTAAGGEKDCPELCSMLLEHKAKIDAVDKDGNQPLHLACKRLNSKTRQLLLHHNADANVLNNKKYKPWHLASQRLTSSYTKAIDGNGNNALYKAAESADLHTVQLLVDWTADVNEVNEDGQTPLHAAAGGEKDCPELCSILLKHNAKIDAVDKDGNQPLHLACRKYHTKTGRLLLSNQADANALNKDVQTPLHTAAGGEKDCPELCSMLLEHNAKIDAVDKDGNQPLHLACKLRHAATGNLLLSHGADVTALNKQQQSPLHLANESILKFFHLHGDHALHIAARNGDIQTVQLLVDCGADVNALNGYGQTPLHTAAGGEKDCPELCSILLKHNAKIDAVDKDGNQPLHLACRKYHTKTGRLLLSNQADANALNKDVQTPLHTAAGGLKDCPELCSILLKHKAKIDAVDKDGNQPLHLACRKYHTKTGRLLLSNQADANALNKDIQTPLHTAAGGLKDCPELCSILLKHKAKIDAVDKDGNQPLHLACEAALTSTVQHLLECNAGVFPTNNSHQTALHKAACSKRDCPEVFTILIGKGAQLNATDGNGDTSLQVACQKGNMKSADVLVEKDADCNVLNVCGETLLHLACKSRVECVKLCDKLISHGVNPHIADREGNLPLHVALKNRLTKTFYWLFEHLGRPLLDDLEKVNVGKEDLVAYLHYANEAGDTRACHQFLELIAKSDISNKLSLSALKCCSMAGYSLLHTAVQKQDFTLCRYLIDHGASVNADVPHEYQGPTLKETPLDLAVKLGDVDLCCLLIEHGATINPEMRGRKGPLHLAVVKGKEAIARLLLCHGADVSKVEISGESALKRSETQGNVKMALIIEATGE